MLALGYFRNFNKGDILHTKQSAHTHSFINMMAVSVEYVVWRVSRFESCRLLSVGESRGSLAELNSAPLLYHMSKPPRAHSTPFFLTILMQLRD